MCIVSVKNGYMLCDGFCAAHDVVCIPCVDKGVDNKVCDLVKGQRVGHNDIICLYSVWPVYSISL